MAVESLALVVAVIVLSVYGAMLIGFVTSWFQKTWARWVTYIFSGFGMVSGTLLGVQLIDGNGLMIAGIPVVVGAFSVWNVTRRRATSSRAGTRRFPTE